MNTKLKNIKMTYTSPAIPQLQIQRKFEKKLEHTENPINIIKSSQASLIPKEIYIKDIFSEIQVGATKTMAYFSCCLAVKSKNDA